MVIVWYLGLLTVVCVSGQKVDFGGCPDVPVKQSFNVTKYAGLWYEIEKNPVPFEFGLKCVTATYEEKEDYVRVLNEGVRSNGQIEKIDGKATIPNKNESAKLVVKLNNMPFKAAYWVLDTDYENYSLVYSCFSLFKIVNAEYLWILARTPTLGSSLRSQLYQTLDDNKISRSRLQLTDQSC